VTIGENEKVNMRDAFVNLQRALQDAMGEVERGEVLFEREGALSGDTWAVMESTVHAVGDKLRDLKTLRAEQQRQEDIEKIMEYIDGRATD
jgi:hypothetical protein